MRFFFHYSHKHLAELQFFDPSDQRKDGNNAYCGYVSKIELVQDAYPTQMTIGSVRDKVLVTDRTMNPKVRQRAAGTKYFYRYPADNVECKMMLAQTMNR